MGQLLAASHVLLILTVVSHQRIMVSLGLFCVDHPVLVYGSFPVDHCVTIHINIGKKRLNYLYCVLSHAQCQHVHN